MWSFRDIRALHCLSCSPSWSSLQHTSCISFVLCDFRLLLAERQVIVILNFLRGLPGKPNDRPRKTSRPMLLLLLQPLIGLYRQSCLCYTALECATVEVLCSDLRYSVATIPRMLLAESIKLCVTTSRTFVLPSRTWPSYSKVTCDRGSR